MKNNDNIDICKNCEVHLDCIKCIKDNMLSDDTFIKLSDLFKVFGDYTRIRIIYALFNKELCVCDIAEILNMSHSSISHQLRTLKVSRLVKFRKEGKTVFYSLDDDHINKIFNLGLEHIKHIKI